MTRDRSSSIASFLVLGQIFCVISAQQCTEQYSIYGTMLKKHIFKRTEASDWSTCVQACEDDLICQSMNYVISKKNCELNNRTKEARPEDFVPNDKRWYMTRLNKRVFLGFTPELPAESCKEIKASEGKKAVNGKYWFDSIERGKAILAMCDMITEDMDECSVSNGGCEHNCINTPGSSVCTCNTGYDLNVDKTTCQDIDGCSVSNGGCEHNCINTPGSSVCTCNSGYYLDVDQKRCHDVNECSVSNGGCTQNCINTPGSSSCACNSGFDLDVDKKTCQDIDECAQGSSGCLPSLTSCINTNGSYSCVCISGYVGDGRISCQPEECQTYTNLSTADRKVMSPYDPNNPKCDDHIGPGWFRFEGAAGTRMQTSCPMEAGCSAFVPGWLNGAHPTVQDGKVSRQVCFYYGGNCCSSVTNIQVRSCSSYYVYYLHGTPDPGCNNRYCSSD